MADSSIPITGGTGYNVDTRTTPGGDHREVVVIGDPTTDNVAKVGAGGDRLSSLSSPEMAPFGITAKISPDSKLWITTDPNSLFAEPFDAGALDTQRWTQSGTVAPTFPSGSVSIAPGTANAASTVLISNPTFMPNGIGFEMFGTVVTLEATQLTNPNVHRFWGVGQVNSYSSATPLTDGAGYEVGIDGAISCVIYVGGTKYVANSSTAANISSSVAGLGGSGTAAPAGATLNAFGVPLAWPGNTKRYFLQYRPDSVIWYIDSLTKPVASATYLNPNVSALPVRLAAITTPATSTVQGVTFNIAGCAVSDSTKQNQTLSDPTYPWRRAAVGKTGGLAVRGAPMTPLSGAIGAGATGTVGPLDVTEAGNLTILAKNTVAASAWAGAPVLVFEQSDDSLSWAAMPVARADTGTVASTHVLPANTASSEIAFNAALAGVSYVRVRVTTGPTTNGMTIVLSPGGMAFQPLVSIQNPTRVPFAFYTAAPITLTATDALVSLTGTRNYATVAAASSPAVVPAGRTMRVTNFNMTFVATATSAYGVARLRANTAGAVVVGSPIYRTLSAGAGTPTTANSSGSASVAPMADGLEFPAGTGIGISVQGYAAAVGAAGGLVVVEVSGYEY